MISFRNDYSELAHPEIIRHLLTLCEEQNEGYGLDRHSLHAAELIRHAINCPEADIHFIPGGTQTNLVAISALLRPFEAVIAAETGHINVHETGAIEATGHKVCTVSSVDGKLSPADLEKAVLYHSDEHMVKPRMVYLSQSTEYGTLYSKDELTDIRRICDKYGLLLFADGARLASALTAESNDLTLQDLGKWTDLFSIGGTKSGAMLGEALILLNPSLQSDFRYMIKNRGAMLAKGFLCGAEFEALFTNDLFFRIGAYENEQADRIRQALVEKGYAFAATPCTNQLFPIVSDEKIRELSEKFAFNIDRRYDSNSCVIRLVTSFATRPEAVELLISCL